MDHVKKHWDSQARRFGNSFRSSWGDEFMMSIEEDVIKGNILPTDSVLDVGCATGFVLDNINAAHKCGIDFSEEMVIAADNDNINVGDARNIAYPNNSFDVVYTVRCLINLPTWEEQSTALSECIRVAKRRVIISEAFYEPLQRLNAIRQIAGLPLLVEHDFNRYIKKNKLEDFLKEYNYKRVNFSGVYYLGSRFIREAVSDLSDYTNDINGYFYYLAKEWSNDDFGIQAAYIIDL